MVRLLLLAVALALLSHTASGQQPDERNSIQPILRRAEFHIARGELDAARKMLEGAGKLAPLDARVPFLLAQCEFNAAIEKKADNRFDRAKEFLREADRLDPTLAATPFVFGLIGIQAEDYASAVGGFREALARGFDPLMARVNLTHALFLLGTQMAEDEELREPEPTIAVFEQVESRLRALHRDVRLPAPERERLKELWVKSRVNLASMHQEAGNYPRAKEILKKLIEDFPENPYHHYDLGLVFGEGHEWDEAMEKYRDALDASTDPLFLEPHLRMGHICSQRGEKEEAERHFSIYTTARPNTWFGNFYEAEHYSRFSLPKRAVAGYLRCIELDQTAFAAMYKLSRVLRKLGRVAEAEVWEALYRVKKAATTGSGSPKEDPTQPK